MDSKFKDSNGPNLGKRPVFRKDSDFSDEDSNVSTSNLPLKAIRGNLLSGYSTYDSGNDDTPDDSENEEQLEKLKEFATITNSKLNPNVGSMGLKVSNGARSGKGNNGGNKDSELSGVAAKGVSSELALVNATKNDRNSSM